MSSRITKLPSALQTKKMVSFAINTTNNLVISRFGDQIAWPIVSSGTNFQPQIRLEVRRFEELSGEELSHLNWTKDLPLEIKNQHRLFWGLKPTTGIGRGLKDKSHEQHRLG